MSFLFAAVASFSAVAAEPPCRAHPNGDVLDFWIGEWRVASEDGASHFGDNVIELALDGCAVVEKWRSASGGAGMSLFSFDARSGAWEQVWVTSDTSRAGGLKRKSMIADMTSGARFRGEALSEDGATYLDRTTLTPLGDRRVRQLIEISTDDGETWRTIFDGYYTRRTD